MQTQENPSKPPTPSEQPQESWLARVLSYVVALVIGLVLVTFLFTTVSIWGNSMMPTLRDNERVFVPKYESWLRRAGLGAYKRGELIYFRPPAGVAAPALRVPLLGLGFPSFLVKRIVGLPGERLSIEGGVVYIDGQALDESFLGRGRRNAERLAELIVPDNAYFVMGDNRGPSGSLDSRRFGPVPEEAIAGRVSFVLWPLVRRENGVWRFNPRPLPRPESYQQRNS
jgi:signal peptidase I